MQFIRTPAQHFRGFTSSSSQCRETSADKTHGNPEGLVRSISPTTSSFSSLRAPTACLFPYLISFPLTSQSTCIPLLFSYPSFPPPPTSTQENNSSVLWCQSPVWAQLYSGKSARTCEGYLIFLCFTFPILFSLPPPGKPHILSLLLSLLLTHPPTFYLPPNLLFVTANGYSQ